MSSGQSANVARVAIRRAEDEDLASASLDCSAWKIENKLSNPEPREPQPTTIR